MNPSDQVIQVNPSKNAWICLVLFVRIGPFQWVAGEKIKTFSPFSLDPLAQSEARPPASRRAWPEWDVILSIRIDIDLHSVFVKTFRDIPCSKKICRPRRSGRSMGVSAPRSEIRLIDRSGLSFPTAGKQPIGKPRPPSVSRNPRFPVGPSLHSLDANVLLYASDPSSKHHERARHFVETCGAGPRDPLPDLADADGVSPYHHPPIDVIPDGCTAADRESTTSSARVRAPRFPLRPFIADVFRGLTDP